MSSKISRSTNSRTKCIISLRKLSDSECYPSDQKHQSLTQNSPHCRNANTQMLTSSSLTTNPRNATLSTTINQSTIFVPKLDLRIKQANETKKRQNFLKKQKNLTDIKIKHQRLIQYQNKLYENKKTEKVQKEYLDKMRKLKLKIFTIFARDTHSLCGDFQRKINTFNIKLFEYLGGDYLKNQTMRYSSTFHYGKDENGESHNRKGMIIDIEQLKKNEAIPDEQLNKELTKEEKKMIISDPNYFMKNMKYKKSNYLKLIPLSVRLLAEDEGEIPNEPISKRDNENFQKLNSNLVETNKSEKMKNCKKIIIASDTEKKLNEFDKMIRKTVNESRTKMLNQKKHLHPNEYFQKTIKNMHRETQTQFAKIYNNIYFTPDEFKDKQSEKSARKKLKNLEMSYENVISQFKRKKNITDIDKKEDDDNDYQHVDLNSLFSYKNFKKEEQDFVNKYNKVIKKELIEKNILHHKVYYKGNHVKKTI